MGSVEAAPLFCDEQPARAESPIVAKYTRHFMYIIYTVTRLNAGIDV